MGYSSWGRQETDTTEHAQTQEEQCNNEELVNNSNYWAAIFLNLLLLSADLPLSYYLVFVLTIGLQGES